MKNNKNEDCNHCYRMLWCLSLSEKELKDCPCKICIIKCICNKVCNTLVYFINNKIHENGDHFLNKLLKNSSDLEAFLTDGGSKNKDK